MSHLRNLLALCKLKVVFLILLTAIAGMFLAVDSLPNLLTVFIASVGIGMSSASAAVFNHVIDEKIDVEMARTKNRPLPQGKVKRSSALAWGFFLGFIGIGLLILCVNVLTAVLTFISLIGYAIIYTIYLKHSTPQNIVIGGAAGAAPPVLGWTAIAGTSEIEYALLLFLIVFVWTPPHFWALAIHRVEDYKKADVPMLPVTHGVEYTKLQILLYTILLFIVTLLPYLTGMSGLIYLVIALILGIGFIIYAINICKNTQDTKIALSTFVYSINYLIILFIALIIDHYLQFNIINLQ